MVSDQGMMLMAMMGLLTLTMATNPLMISVSILILSLMATPTIYKSTPESWIPFVLVITFSTGMMILFLYASSLTSNEVNKFKKSKIILTMMTLMVMQKSSTIQTKGSSENMSTKMMMMTMASVLLATMLALSIQGYAQNQSMSSSF